MNSADTGEGSVFAEAFPDSPSLAGFQAALISWFESGGKSYPWRETIDPYAILVSELMLQQTRIETVLGKGYYRRWLERFPDWEALAAAEESDLLKAWEGLGYYNRARNLQKTARAIRDDFGGRFPEDFESILGLPGVGRYTAGAVFSFAFGKRAPIVDGNVTRVLARIFGMRDAVDTPVAIRFFWAAAEKMTPHEKIRSYNSAIMELGQRICVRSSPSCGNCPVRGHCLALKTGIEQEIPQKKNRVAGIRKEEKVGIAVRHGRIYLCRESGSRRRGLWRLPELTGPESEDLSELFRFDYAITKYKVNLRTFALNPSRMKELEDAGEGRWYSLNAPDSLPPMGSPYAKAIRKYQNLHDELNLSS